MNSARPHASLHVIPYHCPELESTDELQLLVETLAGDYDVEIKRKEPTVTEGAEPVVQLFIDAIRAHPHIAGAAGIIAAGALKRFGEKLCDWFLKMFGSRKSKDSDSGQVDSVTQSFEWEIQINPPQSYPPTHRFPIVVGFEIGPIPPEHQELIPVNVFDDPIYFGIGQGGVESREELRLQLGTAFDRIEQLAKALLQAMYEEKTPPRLHSCSLQRNRSNGSYRIYASLTMPDGIESSYVGTINGDVHWERIT